MTERKWKDYWERYKTSSSGQRKSETSTPKPLEITLPSFNRQLVLMVLLIGAVIVLSFLNLKTGNYLKILENDKSALEKELALCKNQTQNITYDLSVCNENLESCEEDLTAKVDQLDECESRRDELDDSLSSCKQDLDELKDDYRNIERDYNKLEEKYKDCKDDLDDCNDELDSCKDDLDSCESDYDTMKANYAKDYCCLLNQTQGNGNITSWRIEDNKVVCTNSTSDTSLSC